MADLKETWNRHASDLVAGNMAGIMGDFTPVGMSRAMALAVNPISAASFEIAEAGENEVEITYKGTTDRRVWSRWEETSPGKWQITDVAERTS